MRQRFPLTRSNPSSLRSGPNGWGSPRLAPGAGAQGAFSTRGGPPGRLAAGRRSSRGRRSATIAAVAAVALLARGRAARWRRLQGRRGRDGAGRRRAGAGRSGAGLERAAADDRHAAVGSAGGVRLPAPRDVAAPGRRARGGRNRLRQRVFATGRDLAVAGFSAQRALSERPRRGRKRLRVPGRPADPAQAAARRRVPHRGVPEQHVRRQPPGVGRFHLQGGKDGKTVQDGAGLGRRPGPTRRGARSCCGCTCSAPIRPTTTAATWRTSSTPATKG